MKRALARTLLLPLFFATSAIGAPINATGLKVDHQTNPVGVSNSPRLSWALESEGRSKRQFGCHILAASSAENLAVGKGDLLDHKSETDTNRNLRKWAGQPLKTGQEVHWKVRIFDESKTWGDWSSPARFTAAGLSPASRLSGFESNHGPLNMLYEESIAQLEQRLKKFATGDQQGLGTPAEVQRSAREFYYNFDATASLLQYLKTLEEGRTAEGHYPSSPGKKDYNAIDANAGVILPYALWWMAGDDEEAKKRWPIAEKHLIGRENFDPKFTGKQWGTKISAIDGTPPEYLNVCLMGMATRIMRQLALPAGEPLNVIRYKDYAQRIRESFQNKYIAENGSLKIKTQTAHLLALRCAVLMPEQQQGIIDSLIGSLKKDGIKVGPIGAEYLLPVLYLTGNQDLAFELVDKQMSGKVKEHFISNGLTDWMISSLAGINSVQPGYRQLRLTPQIPSSNKIQWIKTHYDSSAGRIKIHWKKEGKGGLTFNCTVPPGVLAQLVLPAAKGSVITESGKTPKDAGGVEQVNRTDTVANYILQSGSYKFTVKEN